MEVVPILYHPDAKIPVSQHEDDVGYDIHCIEDVVIPAKSQLLINTGIGFKMTMIKNYFLRPGEKIYCQIKPRSGLALKNSIHVMAGVVDPCYTGEIKVILYNHGDESVSFKKHDRIAQLVFIIAYKPTISTKTLKPEDLIVNNNSRGSSGFGSTGK